MSGPTPRALRGRVLFKPAGTGGRCSICDQKGHYRTTCAWRKQQIACPECGSKRTRAGGGGACCYECGAWWTLSRIPSPPTPSK
jgi:DNA-directed RNA polymerase subunit RPC12/RpoP